MHACLYALCVQQYRDIIIPEVQHNKTRVRMHMDQSKEIASRDVTYQKCIIWHLTPDKELIALLVC